MSKKVYPLQRIYSATPTGTSRHSGISLSFSPPTEWDEVSFDTRTFEGAPPIGAVVGWEVSAFIPGSYSVKHNTASYKKEIRVGVVVGYDHNDNGHGKPVSDPYREAKEMRWGPYPKVWVYRLDDGELECRFPSGLDHLGINESERIEAYRNWIPEQVYPLLIWKK